MSLTLIVLLHWYITGYRIHITYIYCLSCLQCSVNRSYNSLPR